MGRGRAKAKQTKVARQLKYNSGGSTDLSRLAEELGASPSRPVNPAPVEDDDDELEDDPYAQYADLYNDDDEDDEDESSPSSQRRRA
jgi:phage terminase small subunit